MNGFKYYYNILKINLNIKYNKYNIIIIKYIYKIKYINKDNSLLIIQNIQ